MKSLLFLCFEVQEIPTNTLTQPNSQTPGSELKGQTATLVIGEVFQRGDPLSSLLRGSKCILRQNQNTREQHKGSSKWVHGKWRCWKNMTSFFFFASIQIYPLFLFFYYLLKIFAYICILKIFSKVHQWTFLPYQFLKWELTVDLSIQPQSVNT